MMGNEVTWSQPVFGPCDLGNTDGHGLWHETRKKRAYEGKGNVKWEQASRRMTGHLGETVRRTISVCGHAPDIYQYQSAGSDKAVGLSCVRNRIAAGCHPRRLFASVDRDAQTLLHDTIVVAQGKLGVHARSDNTRPVGGYRDDPWFDLAALPAWRASHGTK